MTIPEWAAQSMVNSVSEASHNVAQHLMSSCGGPLLADHSPRINEAITIITNDLTEPHVLMRPRLFIDGNKWCALYGENLQDGVAGFGDSPDLACDDFNANWYRKLSTAKEAGK